MQIITWKRTRAGGQEAVSNVLPELFVFRYSIERTSDPDKYFYIDITSGVLMTVRSLDREEMGWHNITVLAMEMSKSHQALQLRRNSQTTFSNKIFYTSKVKHHLGGTFLVLIPQFQT